MNQTLPVDSTSDLTVRGFQQAVDESIHALGGYWPPLANLARLFEECGELARSINQRYGPKRSKPGEVEADISEELGDVLYVALALANNLEVDATTSLARAINKARQRVPSSSEALTGDQA